jgi:hypothetical protein
VGQPLAVNLVPLLLLAAAAVVLHCHLDHEPLHAMHRPTGVKDIHPNPIADPFSPLPIVRCGSGMLHGLVLHSLLSRGLNAFFWLI